MAAPFNKLVIASSNTGKIHEITQLLLPLNIEIVPQATLHVASCEEPFHTFIENALAKARHASLQTRLPALADDSGLCVDALGGAPGVISARYADSDSAGKVTQDALNNQKLLAMLGNEKNRTAHFYCVMVLVRHADDPEPLIAEGQWSGEILHQYRGQQGFGYDPLFLDLKTDQTAAELPLAIKNRISHRGHALSRLLHKLEKLST